MVALFVNEAESFSIAVSYFNGRFGEASELMAYLKTLDFVNSADMGLVNGIPAVYYTRSDMPSKLFANYFVGDGKNVALEFNGVDSSVFNTLARILCTSVMAAQ